MYNVLSRLIRLGRQSCPKDVKLPFGLCVANGADMVGRRIASSLCRSISVNEKVQTTWTIIELPLY